MTARHVQIPGTRVAVVPPEGAKPSKNFTGFEIESRNIKYEIVEKRGAFQTFEEGISPQGLEAEGIRLLDVSKVTLNNAPAVLAEGRTIPKAEDEEEMGVVLFVLGDAAHTSFLYGFYPMTERSAASALKTSMLTAIFNPVQQENAGGGYRLSSDGTKLKFVEETGASRFYKADDESGALFTATMSRSSVSQAERAEFAKKTFAAYLSAYEATVSEPRSVTYGGLPGLETTGDFDGGTRRARTASGGIVHRKLPAKGYQVVLFDERNGRTFVMQGVALRDAELYLAQFKKIVSTFTLVK